MFDDLKEQRLIVKKNIYGTKYIYRGFILLFQRRSKVDFEKNVFSNVCP